MLPVLSPSFPTRPSSCLRDELLHKIELVLGAVERAFALRLGQALEIAERLEHRGLQAVVAHHAADLLRRPVEGEEVGLEDLDAVEARRRDGGKLLVEIATDRYRRARGLHSPPPALRKRTDVSRPAGYRLVRRSAARSEEHPTGLKSHIRNPYDV